MADNLTQAPVWIPIPANVPFNISMSVASNWGQRAVIDIFTFDNWKRAHLDNFELVGGNATTEKRPYPAIPSDAALLIKGYHNPVEHDWYDDRAYEPIIPDDIKLNRLIDVHFADDGGPVSPNNLVVHIEYVI